jgi:putative FmdB family regulatory protein
LLTFQVDGKRRRYTMPEYEFECRACKKTFTLIMRLSERASATIRCPGCGSTDVETVMQTFVARTAKKS